ncbi:hypothetical protein M0R01_04780, partial [bacterium]|nr:hypothetical protein [bacterium]
CGTANSKTYTYDVTGYGSDTQCSSGSSSNTAFPTQGGSVNWTCSGQNGGSASGTCTASRAAAPVNGVCGSKHQTTVSSGSLNSGSSGLCSIGPVSNFQIFNGNYWWKCEGSNGGLASDWCIAYISNPCTWSCGSWGACQSGNIQYRSCSSSPSGCTGSNPYATSQSCTYLPPVNGVCNNSCLNCCSSGTAINPYVFNDVHYWQCAGSNGGSTSDWCIR